MVMFLNFLFESVTYFRGGPRFVTVCDRGRGVKNSVTYFMDGPKGHDITRIQATLNKFFVGNEMSTVEFLHSSVY